MNNKKHYFLTVAFSTAFSLVALFASQKSFAWGDTGHRVVGQIAENHLSDSTRNKLAKIIGDETLAIAATWADDVRSDPKYKFQDSFHFVTIPDGMDYNSSPKNPDGDIIVAIQSMSQVLKSKKSTPEEKVRAVRLLAHFVGDIHQPHHVGNEKDRGANWCIVKLFGSFTNLHSVWDSGIIDSTKLSYTEIAKHLDRESRAPESAKKAWQKDDVLVWAKESQSLRNDLYPAPVNDAPPRSYCKTRNEDRVPNELVPSLSYDYRFKYKDLMEERMLKAGIRLAGLLNRLLD
ncbi:MAG: S1/P1 nuclease [Bdellovibrionales bacterium]